MYERKFTQSFSELLQEYIAIAESSMDLTRNYNEEEQNGLKVLKNVLNSVQSDSTGKTMPINWTSDLSKLGDDKKAILNERDKANSVSDAIWVVSFLAKRSHEKKLPGEAAELAHIEAVEHELQERCTRAAMASKLSAINVYELDDVIEDVKFKELNNVLDKRTIDSYESAGKEFREGKNAFAGFESLEDCKDIMIALQRGHSNSDAYNNFVDELTKLDKEMRRIDSVNQNFAGIIDRINNVKLLAEEYKQYTIEHPIRFGLNSRSNKLHAVDLIKNYMDKLENKMVDVKNGEVKPEVDKGLEWVNKEVVNQNVRYNDYWKIVEAYNLGLSKDEFKKYIVRNDKKLSINDNEGHGLLVDIDNNKLDLSIENFKYAFVHELKDKRHDAQRMTADDKKIAMKILFYRYVNMNFEVNRSSGKIGVLTYMVCQGKIAEAEKLFSNLDCMKVFLKNDIPTSEILSALNGTGEYKDGYMSAVGNELDARMNKVSLQGKLKEIKVKEQAELAKNDVKKENKIHDNEIVNEKNENNDNKENDDLIDPNESLHL